MTQSHEVNLTSILDQQFGALVTCGSMSFVRQIGNQGSNSQTRKTIVPSLTCRSVTLTCLIAYIYRASNVWLVFVFMLAGIFLQNKSFLFPSKKKQIDRIVQIAHIIRDFLLIFIKYKGFFAKHTQVCIIIIHPTTSNKTKDRAHVTELQGFVSALIQLPVRIPSLIEQPRPAH